MDTDADGNPPPWPDPGEGKIRRSRDAHLRVRACRPGCRSGRYRRLPVSPHPPFSLFRYLGRIPLIGDAEVAGARKVEDRSKRAAVMGQRKAFTAGQRVRVSDGPGTGLCGNVVQDANGKFIMVAFGDATFKIDSWLLGTNEV